MSTFPWKKMQCICCGSGILTVTPKGRRTRRYPHRLGYYAGGLGDFRWGRGYRRRGPRVDGESLPYSCRLLIGGESAGKYSALTYCHEQKRCTFPPFMDVWWHFLIQRRYTHTRLFRCASSGVLCIFFFAFVCISHRVIISMSFCFFPKILWLSRRLFKLALFKKKCHAKLLSRRLSLIKSLW